MKCVNLFSNLMICNLKNIDSVSRGKTHNYTLSKERKKDTKHVSVCKKKGIWTCFLQTKKTRRRLVVGGHRHNKYLLTNDHVFKFVPPTGQPVKES